MTKAEFQWMEDHIREVVVMIDNCLEAKDEPEHADLLSNLGDKLEEVADKFKDMAEVRD